MKNILRKSNFGFKNRIARMALLRSEPRKLNMSFGGLRVSLLLALTAGWMGGVTGFAQTAPTAQSLPFNINFGTSTFTTLPAGVAVWNGLSGNSVSTQALAESSAPTGNATLAIAAASTGTGGAFGYSASSDGKLYIQSSSNASNGVNQPVIAIVTTGVSGITLAYTVDVINASPKTIGVVAQFRVGASGSWTTLVPTTGSNPFSQGGGTAGLKTTVSVNLPSAAENQPVVQIRWAVWRGTETGNSSGFALDNISVTTAPTVAPDAPGIASASAISTSGFTANWAASSGTTKYFLDVATNSGFTAFVTGYQNKDVGNVIFSAVTGLDAGTTYYYRVRANNSAGTSADSQTQVVLTTSAAAPSITPSVASLTALNYNGAGPSTAQSLTLSVANLTGFPGTVTISGSTNYEVSTTSSSTGFGSSATLSYSDGNTLGSSTVWVRLKAGLAAGSYNGEIIGISGGGATASFTVSGSVTVPVISVTTTNLGNFVGTNGVGSAAKTNTVTGTNLAGAVTMVATNYFQLSSDAGSTYTNTLVLAPTAGVLSNSVLFRIAPDAPVGNLGTNVVTISSPGAVDKTVQVAGVVVYGGVTIAIAGLNTATVAEGAADLALDVTLSAAAPAGGTTVTLATTDTDSSELGLSTTSVVFAEGETTKSVTLTPKTDSVFDPSQTIVITATAPDWSVAGTVSVTVTNTDSMPVSYISLTSLNPNSYTQNFDALGTTTIAGAISSTAGVQSSLGAYLGSSTLDGWYATKVSGSSSAATAITVDAGSGTSGLVYNYGAASATDRALGVLASNSNTMAIGALIKNDTGQTINSIKVSFTAEFWRGSGGSSSTQNVLTCAVGKVDGASITNENFLTVVSAIPLVGLNIIGPLPVAANGVALDGNVAPNRTTFSNVILPVQLAPGETAFVRWQDFKDGGYNAGLAIDDLSMTASLDAASSDGDGTVTIANNTPSSPYALSGIWVAGGANQGVSFNVTPLLDSTTLTSVSILVPTEFGAPVVGNVTTSGGATGGTPAVAGQLVTITGVSVTKANPAVINIAGLSTPTTGTIAAGNGVYPFTVSTAGDGGTLKAVFASPAANVLIPIANIRDIDANGAPVDKNTIVAVEGICTAAPLGATSFIQDASYGIAVFPATTTPPFTLGMVAGRKYAVLGTLVDYNGMAEIKPASLSGVVDLGVDTMPAPISITVAQAKAEQYESMLVTIADLTKDTAETDPWAVSKTITVKNSAGDAIDVRIQAESTATTEPAYPVTITGILAQFSSATPRAATYQIMPRTAGDLSFAPGLKLVWSVAPAVILENGAGFDPSIIFLTVSRVGSSAGTAAVELSISPAGRMINDGSALPQTLNFAAGETSKVLSLTPVDDSVYTGDTVVTITATDTAGVLTVATATAQILEDETSTPSDTIPPVITLSGAATITLDWASSYIDAGATATDNVDSSVTVNSSGSVNTSKPGVYKISYTASDAAGNNAISVERTVIVSAPTSTPGADGVSGLLRYAFGANGPNDSVTKPTTVLSGGNLVVTAIVRVDNAKLAVVGEAVTDLGNYASGSAVTTVNGSSSSVDQTGVPAGCQRQTFTVAQGGDLKKFLRLKVTLAP